jgi:hypothetical protein
MSSELKPPIIIFGNTRSGTTIVQKVMSAHSNVAGWYEPNALWLYADTGRIHDEFDESDATNKVKQYIRKQFLKYQKRHGNCVVLEKTPQNILRIPYVRAIFPEATFLFIVRNPFSFISSVATDLQTSSEEKVLVDLGTALQGRPRGSENARPSSSHRQAVVRMFEKGRKRSSAFW